MNQKYINEQARNSLNTYFKDNLDITASNETLMDKETITEVVKEKIKAHEKKIESLEVLRKNIAVEATKSLNKY